MMSIITAARIHIYVVKVVDDLQFIENGKSAEQWICSPKSSSEFSNTKSEDQ